MVFDSIVRYWNDPARTDGVTVEGKPHIITSNLEHDSVVLCLKRLEKEGHAGEWLNHLQEVWRSVPCILQM